MLASDTPPVRELITDGENGLLVPFFDADALAEAANRVLDDPAAFRPLGRAGAELIRQRYDVELCIRQFLQLCDEALSRPGRPA